MVLNLDAQLAQGQISETEITETEIAEYLVSEYYDAIFHLSLSMLHDRDAADDVTQQTIIRALNKINQYNPQTNMRAWVYTIAVNVCRGHMRKQKVRKRLHTLLVKAGLQESQTCQSPTQDVLRDERDQALWLGVNQLKDKHRIPIILRYNHDMTTGEIAEILDLPHGTVRSRLHYAHKKLHELLMAEDVS